MKNKYTKINAKVFDHWNLEGWKWGMPISHETFMAAKTGFWDVNLGTTKSVPKKWFSPFLNNNNFNGTKILGLASGGGQQMPIFSALNASCTLLDYSDSQISSDRMIALKEGYTINIIKRDMTKKFPFKNNSFDIIFHPVSNSYVENVYHIWNECFRVLKPNGILISGMENGFNFLINDFDTKPFVIRKKLPFNPLKKDKKLTKKLIENDEGIQFSHTFEEQIGGQIKAGFIITDVYEDYNDYPEAIEDGIPAFWATRSIKPSINNFKI